MFFVVKALQYIKNPDNSKWKPVDSIEVVINLPKELVSDDVEVMTSHFRKAVQDMLGRNWLPLHYRLKNAVQ
jgi:hypothetical protein